MRKNPLALAILLLGLSILACLGSGSNLVFSPANLPEARTGQSFKATITVTGNRTPVDLMDVVAGGLPPGLTLTHQRIDNTATISGIPQVSGQFEFTIGVTCLGTNIPGQTGQQAFTLVVK